MISSREYLRSIKKDLFISTGIVKRPVDLDYIKFASALKNKGMDRTDKYDDEAINAMPNGASPPFLFRGNGESFTDVSKEWGTGSMKGYFNGAAYTDLDNDGNLDIIINCIGAPAVILKNNMPKRPAISISFKSDSLNRFGIGCKTYVFQDKKIFFPLFEQASVNGERKEEMCSHWSKEPRRY